MFLFLLYIDAVLDVTVLKCQKAYAYMIKYRTSAVQAARRFSVGEVTFRLYRKSNGLAMFKAGNIPKLFPKTVADTLDLSIRAQARALSVTPTAVITARRWLKAANDVRYTV